MFNKNPVPQGCDAAKRNKLVLAPPMNDAQLKRAVEGIGIKDYMISNGVCIAKVPIDRIHLEPDFQRDELKGQVNRMAADFQPALFNVLVLVIHMGRLFWTADGMNRLRTLLRVDPTAKYVLAQIVFDREGWWILDRTSTVRTSISETFRFRARLVGQQPNEMITACALNKRGIRIIYSGKQAINATKHPAAFLRMLEQVGERRFEWALNTIIEAYRRPDGQGVEIEALSKKFVDGFTDFMRRFPHSRIKNVGAILEQSEFSAAAIIKIANEQLPLRVRNSYNRSGNLPEQIGIELAIICGLAQREDFANPGPDEPTEVISCSSRQQAAATTGTANSGRPASSSSRSAATTTSTRTNRRKAPSARSSGSGAASGR
jgi:hypothetical protein